MHDRLHLASHSNGTSTKQVNLLELELVVPLHFDAFDAILLQFIRAYCRREIGLSKYLYFPLPHAISGVPYDLSGVPYELSGVPYIESISRSDIIFYI
jgi:hypothetical protein